MVARWPDDRSWLSRLGWLERGSASDVCICNNSWQTQLRKRASRTVAYGSSTSRLGPDVTCWTPSDSTSSRIGSNSSFGDFHKSNLQKAKHLANSWQMPQVSFRQHDAFSPESYIDNCEPFDIAIVSGLYELFPSNEVVQTSLAGIRSLLREQAALVYTNQPWHPQLEQIARVLPSHRGGDAWVMRRRTQAEMDQLVQAAGMRKQTMDIDPWGIFTVSTARFGS